ncbi:aminotransferase class I/II-fold pyridoxal phosphate-dependent enzyme [Candidatus Pelagibacter ubique]|nr:aminotransferase class I/II-fold pyridoxal phosphate-dependent enzyme [Candidatus Pelagibacter ubique]
MKINYGLHYIDKKDIRGVTKILKSNFLTQGPTIEKFEKKLKKRFGAKYCIALSSGTAALHLISLVSNWSKKDEIICSPNTFVASANCILYAGAKPVLADIDKETFNLDPKQCEKILKKKNKIKAIIVTDYAGHPADWKGFKELSKKYNVKLINDNCHAIGAKYLKSEKYAVKYADMVSMSFHPVKNITTGEGGAILTNNKSYYEKAKNLRSHGIIRNLQNRKKIGNWFYDINELGYNYRLTDFQSSIGITQLDKLSLFIKKRIQISKIYNEEFKEVNNILTPTVKKNMLHAYHLYPLRINFKKINLSKKKFFSIMLKKGYNLQVHYIPIHFHNYHKKNVKYKKRELQVTEQFYKDEVSLPNYFQLSIKEVYKITKIIKKIISGKIS